MLCMLIAACSEMHEKRKIDGWVAGRPERWMCKEMLDGWLCDKASRVKYKSRN